jgi:hypothetical protein
MTSGYITGGKPDAAWWMEQVHAGIRFRKLYSHEDQWSTWRDYYRGKWANGVLPQNLFFSLLRTIVPRVYFRNPAVSVSPAKPGFEVAGLAQVLSRVDNRMLTQMRVKHEMKRIVQDGFLFGTGFGKLGYGAQYSPTPGDFDTSAPLINGKDKLEYKANVSNNMPWFARLHPGNAILPAGCVDFHSARWFAHWDKRTPEDIKADPRFKNTANIRATAAPDVTNPSFQYSDNPQELVDLVEIRDKKRQTVMVIAINSGAESNEGTVILHAPDELQYSNNIPVFPAVYNIDDEVFWGIPDSVILEPQQLEINEIKTQTMKRRRAALNRILIKKGLMDDSEMAKMFAEDTDGIIQVNGDPRGAVDKFDAGDIPETLLVAKQQIMADVREGLGFSRNEFGEYKPGSKSPTATEANIVKQAAELRIDERRDVMADMLVDMIGGMHRIIFRHWTNEQVEQVVGPGGVPVWVKFAGKDLEQGSYEVKIDPDSSLPETRDLREDRAAKLYELLKQNPLIDPQKLTQYLLTELKGVQMDDLMMVLPAPDAAPGDAMNPGQFGELIEGQFKQLQQQGGVNSTVGDNPRAITAGIGGAS